MVVTWIWLKDGERVPGARERLMSGRGRGAPEQAEGADPERPVCLRNEERPQFPEAGLWLARCPEVFRVVGGLECVRLCDVTSSSICH